jgi:hypothetical protein
MTTIIVDGPAGSGKTALIDTLIEAIAYAKLRQFNGNETSQEFTLALTDDQEPTLFPLVCIWECSWVSAWVNSDMTTEEVDALDALLKSFDGLGIILLGDEDIVDEDQQELFADYTEDEPEGTWFVVEENESEDLIARVRERLNL